MSDMRPNGTHQSNQPSLPNATVLRMLHKSLLRRKTLIHGRLHCGNRHCAIGTLWKDNDDAIINTDFLDRIARVNDSIPKATQQERWAKVVAWVERQLKMKKYA